MSKIKLMAATVAVLPVLMSGVATAATAGQIEGGNIYRVRNVTQNGEFTDPASATCNELVQFKVRVHNPGPDALTNVLVKATLNTASATSHSSTVTVTADNANPASTSDTAGVNLSQAAGMSYVSGSTELLDAHDAKLSTLSDGILAGGVNIGTVGVSTEQKRFVQFEAKVNCPTTPTPTTPAAPTTLVNTGAGDVFAIAGVATLAGAFLYRLRLSRSLSK
jgi:uncharacterized repeat protein (TIGR01451 family)